jgi:hypothetical protein
VGVVYFQFIIKNINDVLLPNTHDSSDLVISSISQIRVSNHAFSEMMRSCKCFPYVSMISTLAYNWMFSVVVKSPNLELRE